MVLRPISQAAYMLSRQPTLIHAWYRAGILIAACDVTTRTIVVDLLQAKEISDQKPRRRPGR